MYDNSINRASLFALPTGFFLKLAQWGFFNSTVLPWRGKTTLLSQIRYLRTYMTRNRIKRIHINMHIIRANAKNGTEDPAITIKVGKENIKCMSVSILGNSKLVYSPHKPILSCGARIVLQTKASVVTDKNERIE